MKALLPQVHRTVLEHEVGHLVTYLLVSCCIVHYGFMLELYMHMGK